MDITVQGGSKRRLPTCWVTKHPLGPTYLSSEGRSRRCYQKDAGGEHTGKYGGVALSNSIAGHSSSQGETSRADSTCSGGTPPHSRWIGKLRYANQGNSSTGPQRQKRRDQVGEIEM